MQDFNHRIPQERKVVTTIPGPRSQELEEQREKELARGLVPGLPAYIVDGDGGVLVDVDGNSFIDFASGIAVTTVGASNPRVTAAIAEAASHLTHTCFLNAPYEGFLQVSKKLNELTPGDHEKKTALFSTGAEAIENAVKIARNYTGKNRIVVFDGAFHGRTNLTMTMTAKNKPYKSGFGTLASDIYRVQGSYPLRDGLSGADAAERTIRSIEQVIGAEDIAALVIEPLQGEGGFIEPAEGFLPALLEWCRANGVVFVADEIQAGMCRTGDWFASNHEGLVPDLITTAKGVGGGMPLSAVTGRAEIMDAPGPGSLGGTYAGNPVACAASLAAIAEVEEHDLAGRAREIESIIREVLEPLTELPTVAEVRGRGAMIALEFVDENGRPNPALTSTVASACKEQGVLILTCGLDGNVIRLLPPLVINESTLRDGLEVLAAEIRKN
ncbi:4-aminobutyrate--2-oxoglutarate transaminase [Corynebacterium striatum]|uniref:4-aminobutyrate--2-oxoglutarate transaminase n=1 Tax=Corynebacterium striatum TaxID=43770 RepID=UPI00122C943E|nr:4-aminobutyrate--2-oxoglutarate transaminase [Corynebacterium striatum]KAA1272133.1 4-aminobutyrate--2-oxoglutarate transaminase [Corynebacterium striatum]MDK8832030.1 4-aminobutyrate--2-oxoglutarate transaminase [Corynebacterium striatum]HCT5225758.1 4-aminobutyrate--2-oxoglutarate transaminase [Corynebacterium striatum]HEI8410134.1 4-aminobutyrate--2-oxoglutarate transaminase [Corynebacterium striatum]